MNDEFRFDHIIKAYQDLVNWDMRFVALSPAWPYSDSDKQKNCNTCKGSGKILLPKNGYKKKERHQRDAYGPCKMCRL